MIRFSTRYFLLAFLLFITEVLIALYVNDNFVRPYVGDYLVVMLIYCAICTIIKGDVMKIATGVLLFSYIIEALQYFNIVHVLGLQNSAIARTVIGTGFEWIDIVAYTLGVVTIVWIEKVTKRAQSSGLSMLNKKVPPKAGLLFLQVNILLKYFG